jgi:hypothetical protein
MDVSHHLQSLLLSCLRVPFQAEDQPFLHRVNAFAAVSRLASESNKLMSVLDLPANIVVNSSLLLPMESLAASSRNVTNFLTDGSTETFWYACLLSF